MGYVPSHLHHICFELFKNSMRATVELHGSVDPPPIKILMTKGKDNVCIKISDRGGGASLDECRRWTHYMYSTAPPPPKVFKRFELCDWPVCFEQNSNWLRTLSSQHQLENP